MEGLECKKVDNDFLVDTKESLKINMKLVELVVDENQMKIMT